MSTPEHFPITLQTGAEAAGDTIPLAHPRDDPANGFMLSECPTNACKNTVIQGKYPDRNSWSDVQATTTRSEEGALMRDYRCPISATPCSFVTSTH